VTETAPLIALLDASTLYPAALRNLLMRLAGAYLFQAKWTAKIQDEWTAALARDRPELLKQIARTRALMETHISGAEVTGYEPLIDQLTLPDPDDRHVLAAAIHAGASVIVTVNLRDFPPKVLAPYRLTAQHPDNFVLSLLAGDSDAVLAVMREHRLSLVNPPKTAADYISTLELHHMTATVGALRTVIDRL
jgi:predicted nucleic acid-binding protein